MEMWLLSFLDIPLATNVAVEEILLNTAGLGATLLDVALIYRNTYSDFFNYAFSIGRPN